uniref:Ig-like domain-containing protein n=2 Tax=Lutzomyia longipalpis TaxID=7200 RepID=A0A1B0CGH8_LUTLO
MSVPPVIRSGDDGNLMCLYDLEQEHLYSTRWYKGRREFYRYTPKENPAKKTFPVPGINVEEHLYSTRWYKGRREFYRYTPKENPARRLFQCQELMLR